MRLDAVEPLVAALALGGEVDVGGVVGLDIALGVGHDGAVDVVADLTLLEAGHVTGSSHGSSGHGDDVEDRELHLE